VAALAVPGGHCVALMELRGQYAPAGQVTGAPEAQEKEVGQGTQAHAETASKSLAAGGTTVYHPAAYLN
jgi:hypothetical protein